MNRNWAKVAWWDGCGRCEKDRNPPAHKEMEYVFDVALFLKRTVLETLSTHICKVLYNARKAVNVIIVSSSSVSQVVENAKDIWLRNQVLYATPDRP